MLIRLLVWCVLWRKLAFPSSVQTLLLPEIRAQSYSDEHTHLLLCATRDWKISNLPVAGDTRTALTPSQFLRQMGMVTCSLLSASFDSKCCRIHPSTPKFISTRKFVFSGKQAIFKSTHTTPSQVFWHYPSSDPKLGAWKSLLLLSSQEVRKLPPLHTHHTYFCAIVLFYFFKKISNMTDSSDTWEPSRHFCTI